MGKENGFIVIGVDQHTSFNRRRDHGAPGPDSGRESLHRRETALCGRLLHGLRQDLAGRLNNWQRFAGIMPNALGLFSGSDALEPRPRTAASCRCSTLPAAFPPWSWLQRYDPRRPSSTSGSSMKSATTATTRPMSGASPPTAPCPTPMNSAPTTSSTRRAATRRWSLTPSRAPTATSMTWLAVNKNRAHTVTTTTPGPCGVYEALLPETRRLHLHR